MHAAALTIINSGPAHARSTAASSPRGDNDGPGRTCPDYLRDLKADWLIELRSEVIEPIRAGAVTHPLIAEVAAGTFPTSSIAVPRVDLLGIHLIVQSLAAAWWWIE